MSFHIFASGSRDFVRSRDGLDFGDAYEIGSAVGRIQSIGSTPAEVAGGEIAGFVEGESTHQQLTELLGRMIGIDLLVTMTELAVAHFNEFHLTLSARNTHWYWADRSEVWSGWINEPTSAQRRRGEPGAALYMLQQITPVLADTEMRNFGVLAAIARILSEWTTEGERLPNGEARILIQLQH